MSVPMPAAASSPPVVHPLPRSPCSSNPHASRPTTPYPAPLASPLSETSTSPILPSLAPLSPGWPAT
eukprot:6156068-Prorocentrum_lima.AAC.1